MNRLIVSTTARASLLEIWNYIAADNAAAADSLLEEFYEKFELLCANPEAGRQRKELQVGLRSFPVGRYVIFYRPIVGATEIVHILHSARDVRSNFGLAG